MRTSVSASLRNMADVRSLRIFSVLRGVPPIEPMQSLSQIRKPMGIAGRQQESDSTLTGITLANRDRLYLRIAAEGAAFSNSRPRAAESRRGVAPITTGLRD